MVFMFNMFPPYQKDEDDDDDGGDDDDDDDCPILHGVAQPP